MRASLSHIEDTLIGCFTISLVALEADWKFPDMELMLKHELCKIFVEKAWAKKEYLNYGMIKIRFYLLMHKLFDFKTGYYILCVSSSWEGYEVLEHEL